LKIRALLIRVYRWGSLSRWSWLLDCIILLAVQAVALESLGLLTNPAPQGDDPLIHIQKIIDLSKNFLHFQWDPRSFNGYIPSTGFAWQNYALPVLFVLLGLDPVAVFHATFLAYFLVFGPSVYYFCRTMGSERLAAIALSVLAWATIGYLGYVGGGAYDRVFTLPLMFISLALTYRYAALQNAGGASSRLYWLLVATWSITLLGDVYIAAVPVAIAMVFLALSAGWNHLRAGVLRLAAILLPSLTLTSWFWIPLLAHVLSIGSPRSDLTVSVISQVFWAGPLISLFAIILRKKSHSTPLRPEQTAIILSITLVSVYFLIMGAFTPLWTYLPRIWSTYDSFDILSFLFPATVACLFGWRRH